MIHPIFIPKLWSIRLLYLLPPFPIPPESLMASDRRDENIAIIHYKPLLLLLELGNARKTFHIVVIDALGYFFIHTILLHQCTVIASIGKTELRAFGFLSEVLIEFLDVLDRSVTGNLIRINHIGYSGMHVLSFKEHIHHGLILREVCHEH